MTEEFILPVVAELTGLTVGGLAYLRYRGRGPRFYTPTPKKVRATFVMKRRGSRSAVMASPSAGAYSCIKIR